MFVLIFTKETLNLRKSQLQLAQLEQEVNESYASLVHIITSEKDDLLKSIRNVKMEKYLTRIGIFKEIYCCSSIIICSL